MRLDHSRFRLHLLISITIGLMACSLLTRQPAKRTEPAITDAPDQVASFTPEPTFPGLPHLAPNALAGLGSYRLRIEWTWTTYTPSDSGQVIARQQSLWLHEYNSVIPAHRMVYRSVIEPSTGPPAPLREWVQIGARDAWQCPGVKHACDPGEIITINQDIPSTPIAASLSTTVTPSMPLTATVPYPKPDSDPFTFPGFPTQAVTTTLTLTPPDDTQLPVETASIIIDPEPGLRWVGQPLLAGIESILGNALPQDFQWLGQEEVQGISTIHLYTTFRPLISTIHPGAIQDAQDIQAHIWIADQPEMPSVVLRLLLTWGTRPAATRGEGVFSYWLYDINAPISILPPITFSE